MRLFKRDKTFTEPIVWLTTFFVIAFHVGAVAALFTFAWKPFVLSILLWWVAGSLRARNAQQSISRHNF
jgi:hypothetical protein